MIIYRSTNLHSNNHTQLGLFEIFLEDFKSCQSNVFTTTTIIVPNLSMASWLKDKIADNLLICSNIKFVTLNEFIINLYKENNAKVTLLNHKGLKSVIYDFLLTTNLDTTELSVVKNYLINEAKELDEYKAYLLAQQLEIIFDEYMFLRTNELLRQNPSIKMPQWQNIIWQHLFNQATPDSPSNLDKYKFDTFIDIYSFFHNNHNLIIPTTSIYIYGLTAIYPSQLEILTKIGNYTNIKWFQPSVSYEYYGDLLSSFAKDKLQRKILKEPEIHISDLYLVDGNPLVANLGQQSREFTELILSNDIDIENIDTADLKHNNTLLSLIQNDIKNLTRRITKSKQIHNNFNFYTESIVLNDANDNSIKINVCHNKMREVQVVFNTICSILELDKTINLSDILIVAPNINEYKTYIQAVFENEYAILTHLDNTTTRARIPYTITGNSLDQNLKAIETLKEIFNMKYELPVSYVINILNQSVIMENLKITSLDIDLINHWFKESNVCFGYDTSDYTTLGYSNFDILGFKRFLINLTLGVCIPQEVALKNNKLGLFTAQNTHFTFYDNLESHNIELCNTLISLIDFILTVRNTLYTEAHLYKKISMSEIISLITKFKNDFIIQESDVLLMDELIVKLKEIKFEHAINLPIINNIIDECFEGFNTAIKFSGKITFTTMQSAKNIPAKFIYVLGMNLGDFPRIYSPNKLSILLDSWVIADRNSNLEDKQLFLDIILAAQNYLYFSYVGNRDSDNSELAPSVLLDLFITVLKESLIDGETYVIKNIIKYTTLHPFINNARQYSNFWNNVTTSDNYQNQHWNFNNDILPLIIDDKTISLKEILNSFYYTNNGLFKLLGITDIKLNNTLQDTEDMSLISKDLKQIAFKFFNKLSNPHLDLLHNNGELYDYLYNSGTLSYNEIGKYQLAHLLELYYKYQSLLGNNHITLTLKCEKYGFNITDTLTFNNDGILVIMDDFNRIKDDANLDKKNNYFVYMKALVSLVFIKFATITDTCNILTNINKEVVHVYLNIAQEPTIIKINDEVDPRSLLEQILEFYQYSLTNPVLINHYAIMEYAKKNDLLATLNKLNSSFSAKSSQDPIFGDILANYFDCVTGENSTIIRVAEIFKSIQD